MSNRMSVLSRRLERFAVIFSIATFVCLVAGLYVASKNESQLLYLVAGVAALCLFATFFLWIAHGFAWALIPEQPVVARRTAEALNLADDMKPIAPMKAAEPLRPVEALKPVEEHKPTAAVKPAETIKPIEPLKPIEEKKPVEALKPAQALKPAEEKKPVEEEMVAEEDPPNAQYTITGRRIY